MLGKSTWASKVIVFVLREEAKLVCRPEWKEQPHGVRRRWLGLLGSAVGVREPASLSIKWNQEYGAFVKIRQGNVTCSADVTELCKL